MSLPKLRQKVDFKLQLQQKGERGLSNVNVDIPNPLRSKHSINWFKNNTKSSLANKDYVDTVSEKLIVHELNRLFDKFDVNRNGEIDLDELGLMFEAAGLIIDLQLLKKIFR